MRKGNWLLIVAILLAAIVGGFNAASAQNYEVLSKDRKPDEIVSVLTEKLQLTEDQQVNIRAIIVDDFEKREELKNKYKNDDSTDELSLLIELRRLSKKTEAKIEEILTEKQMNAYREVQGEFLSKARREARSKITEESILMMKERLQLTDEQADLVLPIIDQAMKERQELMQKMRGQMGDRGPGGRGGERGRGDMSAMREMRTEMERIDERTEERLSKILTDEQMEEYRRIKKEQREKMRERMRERRSGGRGGMGGNRRGGGSSSINSCLAEEQTVA